MNVTLKLPIDLCREARHRAIEEDKSLSAWVAGLVARELAQPASGRKTLLERLGHPASADRDFELPNRKMDKERPIDFP